MAEEPTPDGPGEDEEISASELEAAAEAAATPAARSAVDGAPTTGRGGSRALQFLAASWAELQRVQWPDRRQVGQATAVVIGFVIIAGAYLGLADYGAKELVDFIL